MARSDGVVTPPFLVVHQKFPPLKMGGVTKLNLNLNGNINGNINDNVKLNFVENEYTLT